MCKEHMYILCIFMRYLHIHDLFSYWSTWEKVFFSYRGPVAESSVHTDCLKYTDLNNVAGKYDKV